jgi:TonB family protein
LAGLLSLQDPLVFVEMDLRRITRMNLMATARFSYELTNWSEPYRWLAPSDQYFADDFGLYVASTVQPSTFLTEKTPPALKEVARSERVLPAYALLRIEGGLAGQRLIPAQPLPLNESNNVLTNTVINVSVDSAGDVFSVALYLSSGSTRADQSALTFAKQARFETAHQSGDRSSGASSPVMFGQFVFQWFPVPTMTTNQFSASP